MFFIVYTKYDDGISSYIHIAYWGTKNCRAPIVSHPHLKPSALQLQTLNKRTALGRCTPVLVVDSLGTCLLNLHVVHIGFRDPEL